jgi:hypothetical protein
MQPVRFPACAQSFAYGAKDIQRIPLGETASFTRTSGSKRLSKGVREKMQRPTNEAEKNCAVFLDG